MDRRGGLTGSSEYRRYRRLLRLWGAAAVTGILLGVVFSMSACGTATVDGETVAEEIDRGFEGRTGVAADLVSCPDQIPRKKGETFECTVLVGGTTAMVVGTMTDNAGAFDWEPDRNVVDGDEIAAEIAAELGPDVQVTCEPVIFADPGDPFTCEAVEAGGVTATVGVVIEEDGTVTWEIELE